VSAARRDLASFSPDARLLFLLGAWVVTASAAVVLPPLWPAVRLAGVALLVAGATDAWLLAFTPKLRLVRRTPARLEVGRQAVFEIEIENPARTAVVLEVFDELPADLIDRDPHFEDVRLPPGAKQKLRYTVSPRVRGDRVLGPLAARVRSPLGLLRRRRLAGAGETLRVHPNTSRFLRPEALRPRQVLASLGVKPVRQHGEGMDFESLREYVPGDDPRRIDWRATARRGRLVSRLYQHERRHTVMIAVDASRLMGGRAGPEGRSKLDAAVDCALGLAYAALYAGDRAGLTVFDHESRLHLEPRSHRADLGAFVEALAPVQSRLVEADYRVLVRRLLGRRQRRSLVVILTDFAETDAASMIAPLSLLARRHRVLLVALRDRSFDALRIDRAERPFSEAKLYRSIVLDDLLREREEILARLRRRGLHTLDLVSETVTASVLNRYLSLRYAEA
jgi:uncharacterized protein (DUF58 family)